MKDTDKVIHLNERQNRIMEIMRQQNAVSVATLSSLMKVSEVTIRKDLTMLEEQHMLYRVHGSAILVNRYINDRSVAEKEKLYADEKHAIGVYAARLIGPDDTIMSRRYDDAGHGARDRPERPSDGHHVGVQRGFGTLHAPFGGCHPVGRHGSAQFALGAGSLCRADAGQPLVQQALHGVDGVDLDYGVTTTNHIEASLHKQMIASVQKVIVLADSSKFGRRGFSKICDMSAVDQIITDDKAPASVIERLQESGVDVTVVPVGRRE